MKKIFIILLCAALCLSMCACGKGKKKDQADSEQAFVPAEPEIYEVELTLDNVFTYFDLKQYPTYFKDDEGKVTSVQIAYGLELKPGYYAANSPEYEDSMELNFTAEGVVNKGDFTVDYNTLQFGGTTYETSYTTVSETLHFWPDGNRTTTWTFGLFSNSYVNYFQSFSVTSVKGSIFITVGQ